MQKRRQATEAAGLQLRQRAGRNAMERRQSPGSGTTEGTLQSHVKLQRGSGTATKTTLIIAVIEMTSWYLEQLEQLR
jgi:hypothetical protein